MSDFILIEGDMAVFQAFFGVATVSVQPGRLEGSGPATIGGKRICVEGDESRVRVTGCLYMTPQYPIPGFGTLQIGRLAADQKAMKTKSGRTAVLLRGGAFTAKFQVSAPALQPPPGPGAPVPDSMSEYSGSGYFMTNNIKVKGT